MAPAGSSPDSFARLLSPVVVQPHLPLQPHPLLLSRHALAACSLKVTATAKSLQSCPTLCNPIDSSPPGPPVPGILQARTLEWVAISFSNAWKWKGKVKSLSRVQLFVTPWTSAYQAPPSVGFSRQEYWSGVPLPSPWRWLLFLFPLSQPLLLPAKSWLPLFPL